uniref:Uncharacterized protein n=1 Tax=Rhizophora mucronata TaxID=61149 RepID=A0A2P2P0N1_RHIMU
MVSKQGMVLINCVIFSHLDFTFSLIGHTNFLKCYKVINNINNFTFLNTFIDFFSFNY